MSQPKPEISIVLPAHEEEDCLGQVIPEVLAQVEGEEVELILVDDGSSDGTWAEIVRLGSVHPQVRGLRLSRNFGHQAAILAGLTAARGEAAITLDADGQHPPELIPKMIGAWRRGARVVQSLREPGDDESSFKRATSRWFYRLLTRLAGVEIRPGSADYRLLSREALEMVLASAGPIPFLRGLVPWLGLPTIWIPYRSKRRLGGRTSYSLRRMLRFSIDGILGFSIVPLRLAIALGVAVSGFSFLYLVYVVVIGLTSGEAVAGWASTAGLLSLLGGIQLLTLGVLGEYLGRLFMASVDRPRFVISESTLIPTSIPTSIRSESAAAETPQDD